MRTCVPRLASSTLAAISAMASDANLPAPVTQLSENYRLAIWSMIPLWMYSLCIFLEIVGL